MIVFRVMKVDDDGKPKVGTKRNMLGVRPTDPNNTDPNRIPDVPASAPADLVEPGHGLSTSLIPVRQKAGKGEALFRIETDDVAGVLSPNPDHPPHCLLEVSRGERVTLADFQELLADTRGLWERVEPEGQS